MGAPPLLLSGRLGYKGKRSVIANVPRDVTSPVCLLNGARFSTGPFSKGAPLPGATPIRDFGGNSGLGNRAHTQRSPRRLKCITERTLGQL